MKISDKFDENNYKFNEKSTNGVYIIHGFTNTTYEVKELAEYLGKNGFYTVANNLPGHGTTPEDCNKFKYEDWIMAVEQDVAEMASKCTNISVIGISMGSVLALHLSSIFNLNASIFASTVLDFKNKFSVNILSPLLHRFFPFRSKRKTYKKNIRNKLTLLGYNIWPSSAVNEMRKLTNKVRKELIKVKSPALIIHSKADLLSPQSNHLLVYDSIKSTYKQKIILENAGHNLFIKNPDQEKIFESILLFLKKFNT